MAALKPFGQSASQLAAAVNQGELDVRDVAQFYSKRTSELARKLNSHLYWEESSVEAQTQELQKRLDAKESLPLAGVPVVIKDNICVKGMPTTCASKILEHYQPPYDAFVIGKLRKAGALFFGKANCDEFAMGSSNENSAYGPVKNPWDTSRVPGGSSGGSAAAVASDLAPLALGSDTGGSIRQPAAFCGVVGLKPTYGRVSRYGLVAFGSSLDQIGPFARNVKDTALLFDAISGHDPMDSTTLMQGPANTFNALNQTDPKSALKGKRIGIVKEFFSDGLDVDTRKALEGAVAEFRKLGAEVSEVSLPHLEYSIAAYYVIATAEASSNLARFDGVRYGFRKSSPDISLKEMYRQTRSEGFGKEVKQRIMLGTFALSSGYYDAFYAKANKARYLIASDFSKAFEKVDLLLSPTSPTTAFKIGEKSDDPLAMYLSDICTIAVNLAGIPAISIPCGLDKHGLPVGLQLMAGKCQEEQLLKGAYAYEQSSGWVEKHQPAIGR